MAEVESQLDYLNVTELLSQIKQQLELENTNEDVYLLNQIFIAERFLRSPKSTINKYDVLIPINNAQAKIPCGLYELKAICVVDENGCEHGIMMRHNKWLSKGFEETNCNKWNNTFANGTCEMNAGFFVFPLPIYATHCKISYREVPESEDGYPCILTEHVHYLIPRVCYMYMMKKSNNSFLNQLNQYNIEWKRAWNIIRAREAQLTDGEVRYLGYVYMRMLPLYYTNS